MKLLNLFLIIAFTVISSFTYSQTLNSYSFYHSKSIGDKKVVYFAIENLQDDLEVQDRILSLLFEDPHIYDGNIFSNEDKSCVCQLEIDEHITVEYIRDIVRSVGYDIDFTSLVPKDKSDGIFTSQWFSFHEKFNPYDNYDINKSDLAPIEHYQIEKDKWVNENPEEYEKVLKDTETTIVVSRKDLEMDTEKNRQYILSHPEIFIIED